VGQTALKRQLKSRRWTDGGGTVRGSDDFLQQDRSKPTPAGAGNKAGYQWGGVIAARGLRVATVEWRIARESLSVHVTQLWRRDRLVTKAPWTRKRLENIEIARSL
jgi:hypothetical protein